ncbi:2Fe-2S iron-sulfur cluster binding domain-containing protein [Phenylobacterium sp.]|uniref:2Fe-2S iron-sulfur cluster binding domain-containing protein n=1 Tax=Phenylobacterium sp. TaxID=1871053 RepID=UPI00262ED316|nr:2Fe-2S iron-sulfur cluster binding domain-containing protein [Phenylobacterium sp.]
MYAAHFTFSDGRVTSVPVAPGQTVLEAAMQIDAPIRYDCASGECGACIAQLTSGEAEFDAAGPSPISAAEAASGLRPTCQTRLSGDAAFDLPYALEPQPSAPARHSTRVKEVERLSQSVYRLSLERPEGFSFQSGQYVRLRPPGKSGARIYSIASAPADERQLEFLIRHVPGGLASEWVATAARPDDGVKIQGPLGAFARDDRAARHVFVVGGTGLAPALSMLRDLAPGEGEVVVCFGVTSALDLFHVAELEALAAAHGRAQARFAVFIGEPGPAATQGSAVSLLRASDVAPGSAYYLCGPPAMVESARTTLAALGAPLSAIRAERYLPSA